MCPKRNSADIIGNSGNDACMACAGRKNPPYRSTYLFCGWRYAPTLHETSGSKHKETYGFLTALSFPFDRWHRSAKTSCDENPDWSTFIFLFFKIANRQKILHSLESGVNPRFGIEPDFANPRKIALGNLPSLYIHIFK
jgi:hypothetical protein